MARTVSTRATLGSNVPPLRQYSPCFAIEDVVVDEVAAQRRGVGMHLAEDQVHHRSPSSAGRARTAATSQSSTTSRFDVHRRDRQRAGRRARTPAAPGRRRRVRRRARRSAARARPRRAPRARTPRRAGAACRRRRGRRGRRRRGAAAPGRRRAASSPVSRLDRSTSVAPSTSAANTAPPVVVGEQADQLPGVERRCPVTSAIASPADDE